MKKLTLATLLILSCATALAADYEKSYAFAEAGDYATAFSEWKALAEQGEAEVQYNLGVLYANGEGATETLNSKEVCTCTQLNIGIKR
jgi:TPR repeat protein